MVIDMDGNELGVKPSAPPPEQVEWLEVVMKICVTIFFTVQFFIDGIFVMRILFGISIIEMNSKLTIFINIILLILSVAGGLLISPYVIKWAKQNFARVTK